MARRVELRPICDYEGDRLLRIVRRSSGSVVTWRRAQMILLAAQGMPAPRIAEVSFTSEDRVRDVIHNFNADGFDSLYPRYRGGRPPTFTLTQRQQIKKLALSRPQDHDLPFSTWPLAKLADFLVAEGVVDDISHEGLRTLLDDEAVSFQRLKTWKQSRDPGYQAKKNRVPHLYGLMDGTCDVEPGDPQVVICIDEFGPLNLQPHPGRQWARRGGGRRRSSARTGSVTCSPPTTCHGTSSTATSRHASAAVSSSSSCATSAACTRPGSAWRSCWTNASYLNRIEGHFAALRYSTLDGTDHTSHAEQASMIRRYIAWAKSKRS